MAEYGKPSLFARVYASCRILCDILFGWSHVDKLPRDAVVVVLDVIEPYKSLWEKRHTNALRNMLRQMRGRGHQVIFTRWCRTAQHPLDRLTCRRVQHWSYLLPPSALDAEGRSALLLPDLVQEHDVVLDTVYTNLMAHKELILPASAPLLLCGMWTESCVVNTARAAAEGNREVYVYAPACSGHAGVQTFVLWVMQALYAEIVFRI